MKDIDTAGSMGTVGIQMYDNAGVKPTQDSLALLTERVSVIEEELDPPSDWRQKLVDVVDPKFVQYDRPLLLAVIMGTFTVISFVILFVIVANQESTRTSESCSFSLTLPQYTGSLGELGRMIDTQRSVVSKDLIRGCYEGKEYNKSYSALLPPQAATKEIRCEDPTSTQQDAKIWFTGYLKFCIAHEVKINQAQAYRQSGWQYSPPQTSTQGPGMSLVISQENCYPPSPVFTKVLFCDGLSDRYTVYSVAQGKGVTGEAALKASSDFAAMTCPAKFKDDAAIPWRVDFELEYKICTHRSWKVKRSSGEALGLAMAYQVYIDMAIGAIIITILTGTGIVQKNISAIKQLHEKHNTGKLEV